MSETKAPTHLSQILIVIHYEFLKFFKGKKFFAMIGIAYAVPILLVGIPEFFDGQYPDSPNNFVSSQMSFMVIVVVISAAFFGSTSIVSEFHNKTAYSLFPNPVKRESIWFGKFFAALLISLVISSIFYKVIAIGAWSIYDTVPQELVYSWALSFVVVLMVTSVSFLLSAVLKGQTGATVSVFILFVLIFPMIEGITIGLAEDKPWWLPSFLFKITEFSLYDPYPVDLEPDERPRGPYDNQRFVPYVDQSVSIMVLYTVAMGAASIIIFKKKEMS